MRKLFKFGGLRAIVLLGLLSVVVFVARVNVLFDGGAIAACETESCHGHSPDAYWARPGLLDSDLVALAKIVDPLYVALDVDESAPPTRVLFPELPANATGPPPLQPARVLFLTVLDCGRPTAISIKQFQHFFALGVKPAHSHALLNVHLGANNRSYLADCLAVVHAHGVRFSLWEVPFSDDSKRRHADATLIALGAGPWDWIVHVDSDEFHQYPGGSLTNFLWLAEQQGISHISGSMVDRVSQSGRLLPVVLDRSLAETFPLGCDLTKAVRRGNPGKLMAFKALLVPGSGGFHGLNPSALRNHLRVGIYGLQVDHYKWTADVLDELVFRVAFLKEKKVGWTAEISRLLDQLHSWGDKICLDCPEIKCVEMSTKPTVSVETALGRTFVTKQWIPPSPTPSKNALV